MTLRILLSLAAALPLLGLALAQAQPAAFTAKSITHTATIQLDGSIDRIFPLFGPVREKEWAPGWDPQILFPAGKDVAEGMVFTVDEKEHGVAYWIITRYDPAAHRIAYVNVLPGYLVNRIEIACRAAGEKQTDVTVTYQHTALDHAGNRFVEQVDDAYYSKKMAHWQHAIDHLLQTGQRIPAQH
jgi:hypothetical protein